MLLVGRENLYKAAACVDCVVTALMSTYVTNEQTQLLCCSHMLPNYIGIYPHTHQYLAVRTRATFL